MFGPNSIVDYHYEMKYSHRTEKFKQLFKECRNTLIQKFQLQEYDLVFIPGSGTSGMEAVISSLKDKVNISGPEGKFKSRWLEYAKNNGKYDEASKISLFCQLETSNGKVYEEKYGIVDAISSFPYYEIPEGTRCFVTCSNKQLGAFPGLALVFIRKDSWHLFEGKDYFCTKDLLLYKDMADKFQTPTTPPVQIYAQLNEAVSSFDLQKHRRRIEKISKLISDAVKAENCLPCPVVNIRKDHIDSGIATKYELYNSNNDKEIYQIFTYSNKIKKYKELCEQIRGGNKNEI